MRLKKTLVTLLSLVVFLIVGAGAAFAAPPPVPQNFRYTSGSGEVILAWDAVAGASYFRIYQVVGGTPQYVGETMDGSQTTYTYQLGTVGSTYEMYVVSVNDPTAEESAASNHVTFTFPAMLPPAVAPVIGLTEGRASANYLEWSYPGDTDDVTEYRVYRNGVQIATVAPDSALNYGGSYSDATTYTYTYAVQAHGEGGTGPISDPVTITGVDGNPPSDISFNVSLTGLGTNIGNMLTSLSPIFLAVVGTILASAALGWGVGMFQKSFSGGRK